MKNYLALVATCALTLIIFSAKSKAAFEAKGHGTSYIGSGQSGVASTNGDFGIFINPAKLAGNSSTQIGLFYRNFYQISGLDQISLYANGRPLDIPLSLGVTRFGNNLYAETEIRLGSAYNFEDILILGISFNLYSLHIKNYGDALTFGFDFSGIYRINEIIRAAFVVSNINEPEIGSTKNKLPAYLAVGISYRPLKMIEMNLDIVKEKKSGFDYRFGVNYNINNWFSVMAGFRQLVNSFTGGLKFSFNQLDLGYAMEYHPVLGLNHSISTTYEF